MANLPRSNLVSTWKNKATKRQRIIVGLLCIPIALIIAWLVLMFVYRAYVQGLNFILKDGTFFIVLLFLGYLFNRSAYMLLKYANGKEQGHLLHPYFIFGLTVIALLLCIAILGLLIVEFEAIGNNKEISFGRTFGAFVMATSFLTYAVNVQYQKIFVKKKHMVVKTANRHLQISNLKPST